jgi:hypothetical protein
MINKIPDIIVLFKCAQDGLINLMDTYVEYPIIVHCLKYYYSIIETHINEQLCDRNCIVNHKIIKVKTVSNKNKYKMIEMSNDIVNDLIDNIPEEIPLCSTTNTISEQIYLYTPELLEKFYSIWTESRINIVLGMIKYLLLETSPIDYVRCIQTFIVPIDSEIYNIIHQ